MKAVQWITAAAVLGNFTINALRYRDERNADKTPDAGDTSSTVDTGTDTGSTGETGSETV